MARLSTGEFLATLRREKGFTQQEVADKLDVSNRTVSAWEKDKAMPDVLLLPAIGELYGVTVDEILRGAKKSETIESFPSLSPATEKALLRKKLARFTVQAYVLLGISVIGQLFIFLGWFNEKFTFYGDDFHWWAFAMYMGLVVLVATTATLFALWRSCESSVDSNVDGSNLFFVKLYKRICAHFYVAAALNSIFAVMVLVYAIKGFNFDAICVAYFACALIFAVAGLLLNRYANKKWDGDNSRAKRNKRKVEWKKYWQVSRWGLIPISCAIVLMLVFSFVWVNTYDNVYQEQDVDTFVKNMETFVVTKEMESFYNLSEGEYDLRLSEYYKTAPFDEAIAIDYGFTATFYSGSCVVYYEDHWVGHYWQYEDNGVTVFNVRFPNVQWNNYNSYGNLKVTKFNCTFRMVNEHWYGVVFWIVGAVMIVLSVVVCSCVYYVKYRKGETDKAN